MVTFFSDYLSRNDGVMSRGLASPDPTVLANIIYMYIGKCIPSSCTEEDLRESTYQALVDILGVSPELADLEATVRGCTTKDDKPKLEGGDYFAVVVFAFFGGVVIIGTLFDLSKLVLGSEIYPELWSNILMGFSAYSNTKKLFDTSNIRPDSLTSINGIRFISMTWVLVGHAYTSFQGILPMNNPSALVSHDGEVIGSLAFQAIENSWPSVDSFFFIGATLLAYITLKELDKKKVSNAKFWTMYYVHRYIRLTGVYSVAILFCATLLKFFATGPQAHALWETDINTCREAWWTNLLYINNLNYFWDEEPAACIGQAWYLANDMQFFVVSPLIIFPLWKWPRIGLVVGGAFVAVSTAIPMILAGMHDYPFSMSCCESDYETAMNYFFKFYIVPWARFQPYILGLLFGYFLHKLRDIQKLKINPAFTIWLWAIFGVIGSYTIYGLYDYHVEFARTGESQGSLAERIAYNGLHRAAWSVSLGWLILACTKQAGGPINAFLSWNFWLPLSRLSYSVYIVHLTTINYFNTLITDTIHFSQLLAAYWVLAMFSFSLFVAYIAYIFIEIPCVQLEKLFFAAIGITTLSKSKEKMTAPKDEKMANGHEVKVPIFDVEEKGKTDDNEEVLANGNDDPSEKDKVDSNFDTDVNTEEKKSSEKVTEL